MNVRFKGKGLKILDFDCECRPLSWYGGDFVTKEITAIAAKFVGTRKMYCWVLGEDDPTVMLSDFVDLYNEAGMVTGHFIRGFDLPLINGALFDNGLLPLGPKLSCDTKLDLIKFSGLSKSQENLGALLGTAAPKVQMDQHKWREANRLKPWGIEQTKKRVIGDVKQHIELRASLLEAGMLGPPKVWFPGSAGVTKYEA